MATKKDIKTLFRSIRNGDQKTVQELIEGDRDFANICAFAPPKKDDGQSPLQVAFKTGQFEIASYLIDKGADVNHMEDSAINTWRAPVLHDALRAAAFNTGLENFRDAIGLIRRMLELGADPNALDSFGNSCLMRAILDAKIRLPIDNAKARPEMVADLALIFSTLISGGADVTASNAKRSSAVQETQGTFLEQFVVER
jgi:ankyrin repeat protein